MNSNPTISSRHTHRKEDPRSVTDTLSVEVAESRYLASQPQRGRMATRRN